MYKEHLSQAGISVLVALIISPLTLYLAFIATNFFKTPDMSISHADYSTSLVKYKISDEIQRLVYLNKELFENLTTELMSVMISQAQDESQMMQTFTTISQIGNGVLPDKLTPILACNILRITQGVSYVVRSDPNKKNVMSAFNGALAELCDINKIEKNGYIIIKVGVLNKGFSTGVIKPRSSLNIDDFIIPLITQDKSYSVIPEKSFKEINLLVDEKKLDKKYIRKWLQLLNSKAPFSANLSLETIEKKNLSISITIEFYNKLNLDEKFMENIKKLMKNKPINKSKIGKNSLQKEILISHNAKLSEIIHSHNGRKHSHVLPIKDGIAHIHTGMKSNK